MCPLHNTNAICVYVNPINSIGTKYVASIKNIWYLVWSLGSHRCGPQWDHITVRDVQGLTAENMSSGIASRIDTVHTIKIIKRARPTVLWKRNGWHIAYHLSTDIELNVKTDTDMNIDWNWKIENNASLFYIWTF